MFDKFEFKNESDKLSKSPSIEKKLSPIIFTPDKKPLTPTKTVKTNVVGRRPGPKSSK